ncbi:hypothetical protein [Pseudomonas alloputida]|uniref:hypothetical protein n=1 Tax=Pseudomonas alloputida TaxID=1940621 RepID=UPI001E36CFF7|nr:hypothetical protein [Pseudomonas alloputida]MCE0989335.1 hypothetical protein [Pseudomonas alloputida]
MDTNKMRDAVREQFEEFFKANVAQLIRCGAVDRARFIETQREMWLLVWEASRESVVVELPDVAHEIDESVEIAYGFNCALKTIRAGIEAQGLKVAP